MFPCLPWRQFFATAGLTGQPVKAFNVGLAASLGAGISMRLAEALSDDVKTGFLLYIRK